MIKIDLHIHTSAAFYEKNYDFSLNKLREYVTKNKLNVIAITNHNHFDREQFLTIKKSLNNQIVLPGVEVDLENSHLLLIGDVNDVDNISDSCELLSKEIKTEKDTISYEKFVDIFPNYKQYILIPHYKKSPAMQSTTINKFKGILKCGEVRSAKQFEIIKKQCDKLVPVLFSDIRITDDLVFLPVRNTYIDISKYEFTTLKLALSDKNKVFINNLKEDEEFEFLPNGTTASTKLNVIIGKRSSGKTYNLEQIYESRECNNIKYIRQFSLTGQSEETKFKELLNKEQIELIDQYLMPLKNITDKILDIDEFYDKKIDDYLSSLKEYAENQALQDAYSKSKLFNEILFNPIDNLDTKDIIMAVKKLLESENNYELIDKYINRNDLKKLLNVLINKRKEEYKIFKLKKEVDTIIKYTKKKLSEKSSSKRIQDVDLYNIEKNRIMIKKYDYICNKLKEERLVNSVDVYRFKTNLYVSAYKNTSELKKQLHLAIPLKEVFSLYNEPYRYVKQLQKISLEKNDIYKAIINFNVEVLNDKNLSLSGGERAEYNLLRELKDSENYDIVLLDEPEASFDNPFIKEYIIDIIKNISNKTTVFLSTHNNTLGILLKPNKIIYTKVCENGMFKVFTGNFGDKYLKTKENELLESYDNILDVMEAGENAYEERREIYESFKNR